MRNKRILAEDVFQNNNTWVTRLNNNDLIIGPSGAGKTRGYVIPNILQANESMIIADTKGDLKDKLSPYLKSRGYEVQHINFKNTIQSDGYNPLDFVSYNKNTRQYNEQSLLTISHALVPDVVGDKDPFWNNSARMYLVSMIAFVLETYPSKEHHLNSVLDVFLKSTGNAFKEKMQELYQQNSESYAFRTYLLYRNNVKSEKTDVSIRAVLAEKFNGLFNKSLSHMYTKSNRINFTDIGKDKTVVFLSISDMDRSMDKLINVFYTQAFQVLTTSADQEPNHHLQVPVRFILDDFATNAFIKDFDNITSVIRSREIYVSVIIQSMSQLASLYGHNKALTISNNCDNWLYLGGQDVETATLFAKKTNRPVVEVLQMDLDAAYLFTRGTVSKKTKKYNVTKHPNYKEYLKALQQPHFLAEGLPF